MAAKDKTSFKVISKAPFVAGQRSPGEGETIMLTEAQAEHALINGEIERVKPEKAPKAKAQDNA